MKNRGIYGTNDGSYNRGGKDGGAAIATERFADAAVDDGENIKTFQRMLKEKDWANLEKFSQKLRQQGYAQFRVESMMRSATVGVRF